jgi:hypothetical protein
VLTRTFEKGPEKNRKDLALWHYICYIFKCRLQSAKGPFGPIKANKIE